MKIINWFKKKIWNNLVWSSVIASIISTILIYFGTSVISNNNVQTNNTSRFNDSLNSHLLSVVDTFKTHISSPPSLKKKSRTDERKNLHKKKYSMFKNDIPVGVAFYDSETKISFTVLSINQDLTARIVTDFPDPFGIIYNEPHIIKSSVGQSWTFTQNEKEYKFILSNLYFLQDHYGVTLVEL